MEFYLTPELLAAIAGAVISLIFSYVPGLSVKFAELLPEHKRLIMAGIMLVAAAAIYGGSCYGLFESGVSCDQPGVIRLVSTFISAVVANQGIFGLSPQTEAVREAKA